MTTTIRCRVKRRIYRSEQMKSCASAVPRSFFVIRDDAVVYAGHSRQGEHWRRQSGKHQRPMSLIVMRCHQRAPGLPFGGSEHFIARQRAEVAKGHDAIFPGILVIGAAIHDPLPPRFEGRKPRKHPARSLCQCGSRRAFSRPRSPSLLKSIVIRPAASFHMYGMRMEYVGGQVRTTLD